MTGSLFTTKQGKTFDAISLDDLEEWASTSRFARLLLEQVRLVPRFESVLTALTMRIDDLRQGDPDYEHLHRVERNAKHESDEENKLDSSERGSKAKLKEAGRKDSNAKRTPKVSNDMKEGNERVEQQIKGNSVPLSKKSMLVDRYNDRGWFPMHQSLLLSAPDVHLLVGPIVGKVTSTSAILLLELNRPAAITVHICLISGIDVGRCAFVPPPPDDFCMRYVYLCMVVMNDP